MEKTLWERICLICDKIRFELWVMLLLVMIIGFLQPLMVIPAVLLVCAAAAVREGFRNDVNSRIRSYINNIVAGIDHTKIDAAMLNTYPITVIDSEGTISWCNRLFTELFPDKSSPAGSNIFDIIGVKLFELKDDELSEKIIFISSIGKYFRVIASEHYVPKAVENVFISNLKNIRSYRYRNRNIRTETDTDEKEGLVRLYYWINETEHVTVKKNYYDEKVCIMKIAVDNIDEIVDRAKDERKAVIAGEIEKLLRQWAIRCQGAIFRISRAKFIIICDTRNLTNNAANKFPILDDVRAVNTGIDIPASLSIGIGAMGKTIGHNEDSADAALELAIGRGGDQVVVRKGDETEYYGGKLQTFGKRNKGKSWTVALALRELIDEAEHVFIMGHKLADMDSLGSALGISRLVRMRNRTFNIVINSTGAVDVMYSMAVESGEYSFISGSQAESIATKNDLLIILDTQRPAMLDSEKLPDIVGHVVIIDHHRRNEDTIVKAKPSYIEPFVSSTAELVTEMLQYTLEEQDEFPQLEANALLSGLVLDTRNFSVKTGVRTFDAASWLKRMGADPVTVRGFFQENYELFKYKASIIARAERIEGNVAISYMTEHCGNMPVIISKAADELLDIKGMNAAIVLGEDENEKVRVSARSLGKINVEMLMKKIGGGGTATAAGAQTDMSMDDVIYLIKQVVTEYLDEEKEKESREKEKEREKEREKEKKKEGE